jgi:hypothetical protein
LKAREQIDFQIIDEVKEKVRKFKYPQSASLRTVLIYVGDLNASIIENNYFDHILEFGAFLHDL